MIKREEKAFREKLQGETREALRKMEGILVETGQTDKAEVVREFLNAPALPGNLTDPEAERERRLGIMRSGGA